MKADADDIPWEMLKAAARQAQAQAYAPYSGYRVGACVQDEQGRLFAGANVENAAYPLGICAEAAALAALVTGGGRRIAALALTGGGSPEALASAPLCVPCGGCRQRLLELAVAGMPVLLFGPAAAGGEREIRTALSALLPHGFTSAHLSAERVQATPAVPAVPAALPAVPVVPAALALPCGTGRREADQAARAAAVLTARAPGFRPALAVLLGSGLGGVAESLEGERLAIPYADLPGFPRPQVAGHAGRVWLGTLAGQPAMVLEGRSHLYEGAAAVPALTTLVQTLRRLGGPILFLTGAAGSLHPDWPPGRLVRIADHLNLMGANPLQGPHDPALGPRFPDLSHAWDPALGALLEQAAARSGLPLERGIYAGWLGPSFETAAEVQMMRRLGADLCGMSMVPEAILARQAGLAVVGCGVIVNPATGLAAGPQPSSPSHPETLSVAAAATADLARLLRTFAGMLPPRGPFCKPFEADAQDQNLSKPAEGTKGGVWLGQAGKRNKGCRFLRDFGFRTTGH